MKMSELKTVVRSMADRLKADYGFDAKSGKVQFKDVEQKLVEHLPEELSMDQLKVAQSYLIDATAAHTLALGEVGLSELKAKGAVNRITSSSRLGYSSLESSFTKEQSGEMQGKPWRKVGKSVGTLVVGTGRNNTSFKEVQRYLEEKAESVFSK